MTEALTGRRILVVEDDYTMATDLGQFLEGQGVTVVGPVDTVRTALALVEREQLDGAVLDINLRGELVYPVADLLIARAVPIVFATGYDELMERPYSSLPRCQKPVDKDTLVTALAVAISARG